MLDSEHEISEQFDDTKLAEHDILNMYFRIYKHILYSAKKNFFTFFFVFLLSIEVT